MDKEMAGFVACMQQFELACDQLSKIKNLTGQEHLPQLKSTVTNFFGAPSKEAAQDLMDLLKRMKLQIVSNEKGATIFSQELKIDSQTTTLDRIGEELLELLEEPDV